MGAEGGHVAADASAAVSGEEAGTIFSSYLGYNCPKRRQRAPRTRSGLLRSVELRTAGFRYKRSVEASRQASEARRQGRRFRAKWFEARAKGQLERFDQVRNCGGKDVVLSCGDCGHVSRRTTAWCRHWRLCIGCRSRRGLDYRKRFRHSREIALRELSKLAGRVAPGCKLSEKMLTLTLPHSGDLRRDVRTLPRAWRWFWRWLREHLELDRGIEKLIVSRLVYMRVIEVTAGQKRDGHAHMHVYLIAPYVHHEMIGLLWARAISRCGYVLDRRCAPTPLAEVLGQEMAEWRRKQLSQFLVERRGGAPLDSVPNPVVDIQECYGGIENELIKYLIKDAERDEDGALVFDDEFLACVYEGTEGVRMVQTSRGFWVECGKATCACEECGSVRVRRKLEKAKPVDESDPVWSAMDLPAGQWGSSV
jgi:hypothetical protein